jgi:predicted permease
MRRVGVYRSLLWCYPAPFRREYGREMVDAFAEQIGAARREGGWLAELGIWTRTVVDVGFTAPQEHRHVIQQDLRHALRTLIASPGFAAVAVLSLALGIGANTAIFSVLHGVAMRPLPVQDPDRLVILSDPSSNGVAIGSSSGERELFTYAEFEQLRDRTTTMTSLLAVQSQPTRVSMRIGDGEPEDVLTALASAEYFTTLGVPAALGRTFTARDAAVEGAAPYAVISDDFRRRRFAAGDAIGARLTVRDHVFTIVGVTPPAFFGETVGQRPDVWVPMGMQAVVLPTRDWLRDVPRGVEKVMWLHVIGRLAPGKTLDEAQAEANVIFKQALAAFYGASGAANANGFLDQRIQVRPGATGASELRDGFAEPLRMLLGAAAVVLLIACANLGNLMLARTTARSREMSVRLALGASRGRLIRQLLTESLCVACAGGVAGLFAAAVMRGGLLLLAPRDTVLPAAVDGRVLAFAFFVTLAAGLVLGLLPALRATSAKALGGLREQGRGLTGSSAWHRVSKLVVVLQLALSLPLLVGAGLLVRTLTNLQRVDLGYDRQRLFVVRVDVESGGYAPEARITLFEELLQRLRAVPGVRAATYSANGLFTGNESSDDILVEGYTSKGEDDHGSRYDHIGPGYFSTMGIPIRLGREIGPQDHAGATQVCVINESFAKLFFAGRSPLGLHITQVYGNQRTTYQVVGVAANSRGRRLRGEVETRFFVPVAQPVNPRRSISYLLRTRGEPAAIATDVRRAVRAVAPSAPITVARTLTELIDERTSQERLLARLSVMFGTVGLLLAAIGLYGVLSYGITRRTNEIGIRKALGAQHRNVITLVLRETGALLVVGLLVGGALSALSIQLIASRLYGLAATDPTAIGVSTLLLAAVALAATALPAWRASRIDPLTALRYE